MGFNTRPNKIDTYGLRRCRFCRGWRAPEDFNAALAVDVCDRCHSEMEGDQSAPASQEHEDDQD